MRFYRVACLALLVAVSIAVPACAAPGSVSVNGTWVGKGTWRHDSTPFAMLIIVQEGNAGSLTAQGQTCTGSHRDPPGTWISYTGQGHNNDIQGNGVDLTLIEAQNPSQYFGFHGTLSGSTLMLDDEISNRAPVHLTLQQGTAGEFQQLCNGVAAAITAASTSTAAAEAAAATATVQAAPQLSGSWAVAESNVVCTPGSGQPASVCSGNLANYSFIIQQSGLDLIATIPADQNDPSTETLNGSLQGDQFTVKGIVQFQTSKGGADCYDAYTGSVVATNQLSGTYTSKCEYGYGALILNQTGDWTATRG